VNLTQSGGGILTVSGPIVNSTLANTAGELILAASNSLNTGSVSLTGGTLVVANGKALNTSASAPANINTGANNTTIVLATDGTEGTQFSLNTNTAFTNTLVSGNSGGTAGVNHTLGTLTLGGGIVNVQAAAGVSGGTITLPTVNLTAGSDQDTKINPTTAAVIVGTIGSTSGNHVHTIELGGTRLDSVVTGALSSAVGSLPVLKSDTGEWTLLGSSNFTGNVTVSGGTLVMAGTNNYAGGTTIGVGGGAAVLRATANGALGSSTIQFDGLGNGSTARLELAGGIALNNAINLPARSNTSVAVENISGSNTLGGGMVLGTSGANYTIQSDAGLLTLSGGTAITLGTGVTGTRTVTFQGAGNGLITGALTDGNSGSLAITMNSAGTLTLSGTNTYTGGTNVFNGTLVASSPSAFEDGSNLYVGSAALYFAPVVPSPVVGGAVVPSVTAVPEPGTLALLTAGALGAVIALRRRKRIAKG
jgi:autotransporter-associated beta strand protein